LSRILFSILSFIIHFIKRKDEHSLHSPFLFDFYTKTIKQKKRFVYKEIENERILLFSSNEEITFTQLGAKTRRFNSSGNIGKVSKSSLSNIHQTAFLGAMVAYLQPKTILELGTSFGISTCYLSKYAQKSKIITLEGNKSIAQNATERFQKLGFENIRLINGNFDATLSDSISNLPSLDFVFFDGNHRYEPTMKYFNTCLSKITEESTFVFHDIYWSNEMAKAWNEIKSHPRVMISVDLYYFGIVFFRTNQPKQDFILEF
jgi:predicted O-methyltransferase YrrM